MLKLAFPLTVDVKVTSVKVLFPPEIVTNDVESPIASTVNLVKALLFPDTAMLTIPLPLQEIIGVVNVLPFPVT